MTVLLFCAHIADGYHRPSHMPNVATQTILLKTRKRAPLFRPMSTSSADKEDASGNQLASKAIQVLALSGGLETAFLTWSKLNDNVPVASFCSEANSCGDVLSGPYASLPFVGVPLVAIGCLAYFAVFGLSIVGDNSEEGNTKDLYQTGVLTLSTSMAAFSGYLMVLLAFVLHASCKFCFASAAISISMAAAAFSSNIVPNKTKSTVIAGSSATVTALASAFLFYVTSSLTATEPSIASAEPTPTTTSSQQVASSGKKKKDEEKVFSPPVIKQASTERSMKLVDDLNSLNAKMYGAYWCSHCYNQKEELGKEAVAKFTYIECDKQGLDSQYSMCRANKIPGYPTWEINGNYYPGEKSLDELEKLVSQAKSGADMTDKY